MFRSRKSRMVIGKILAAALLISCGREVSRRSTSEFKALPEELAGNAAGTNPGDVAGTGDPNAPVTPGDANASAADLARVCIGENGAMHQLVNKQCASCHLPPHAANKFDLSRWPAVSRSDMVKAFDRMLAESQPMPPSGLVAESDYRLVRQCVAFLNTPASQDPPPSAYEFLLASRLLTPGELAKVIDTAFGPNHGQNVKATLPEVYAAPFVQASGREVTASFVEAIETMANALGDYVAADVEIFQKISQCAPSEQPNMQCLTQFAGNLAQQLLRRPLTAGESTAIAAKLASLQTSADTTLSLSKYVVALLFQHPESQFLLLERDANGRLAKISAAQWLAFTLTGSPATPAMLASATTTDFKEAAEAATNSMLASSAALDQVKLLHSEWLGYTSLPHSPQLSAAMIEEVNALVELIADGNRPWFDIYTYEPTYLTPTLASHYGVSATASQWMKVQHRGGILSHGALLSHGMKGGETSPVVRGKFILEKLLCGEIPPPPPDVDVDSAPAGGPGDCKEQRYAKHSSNQACASCHSLIDPLGFGLENFDGQGLYRTVEPNLPTCTIPGIGKSTQLGEFRGPADLGKKLAAADPARRCMAQRIVEFASGRNALNQSDIDAAYATFKAADFKLYSFMKDYLVSVVLSEVGPPKDEGQN